MPLLKNLSGWAGLDDHLFSHAHSLGFHGNTAGCCLVETELYVFDHVHSLVGFDNTDQCSLGVPGLSVVDHE